MVLGFPAYGVALRVGLSLDCPGMTAEELSGRCKSVHSLFLTMFLSWAMDELSWLNEGRAREAA
jgi:hypothetical protein